ncbi:MAG: ribonuclease HI [Clostridia bacterium]
MKEVDLYTDGACSGNPGPGGWAAILLYRGNEKVLSGFEDNTTNNRMELLAAIKGLQALKMPCKVNLYSDSSYLINAFQKGWIKKWIHNSWKTSSKKPVENQELWKCLIDLSNLHSINWIKVKGHADNPYNNRCDEIARREIKKHT